jgi:hypothetical protein
VSDTEHGQLDDPLHARQPCRGHEPPVIKIMSSGPLLSLVFGVGLEWPRDDAVGQLTSSWRLQREID